MRWRPAGHGLGSAVIEVLPERCKIVARMGIGLDNIDIPEATARDILVTNVPDYCIEEVADHAMGLLLALTRNIGFFHRRTKLGEYDLAAGPPMQRLSTLTCGLLGLGRIGRMFAERAAAFGMRVIAHTSSGNNYGLDCEMVSFEELLARSDVLSLHAPLTNATRHIMSANAFAKMKPTAHLINTSRGGLIDEEALRVALETGRLAGAGLDVFSPEPPDLSQGLFKNERVIVTPHAAFVSEEALVDLRTRVARQIAAALSGEQPENIVNQG